MQGTVRQVLKDAESNQLQPVYICFGSESYTMGKFLEQFIDKLLPPDTRQFALSTFDLSQTPLDAALDDAETAPFLVDRKVVIAKEAWFFTGSKDKSKIEHHIDRLTDYLDSPSESTVIIFTVRADKLDERKKIVKRIKNTGGTLSFGVLSADDLQRWVASQAAEHDCRIDLPAIERLIASAGTNLQALNGEMHKLSLYVGAGGTITEQEIDSLVVRNPEQTVFMLVEEAIKRNAGKAMAMLRELLKQREEPIKILALMARQFRIMLQVKQLSSQGFTHQQIAGQIGLHPYPVKLAHEQGRSYSDKQLMQWLSKLADLDYRMKTGRIEKILGLEVFLLELAA